MNALLVYIHTHYVYMNIYLYYLHLYMYVMLKKKQKNKHKKTKKAQKQWCLLVDHLATRLCFSLLKLFCEISMFLLFFIPQFRVDILIDFHTTVDVMDIS